jgi:hypothetical protein
LSFCFVFGLGSELSLGLLTIKGLLSALSSEKMAKLEYMIGLISMKDLAAVRGQNNNLCTHQNFIIFCGHTYIYISILILFFFLFL